MFLASIKDKTLSLADLKDIIELIHSQLDEKVLIEVLNNVPFIVWYEWNFVPDTILKAILAKNPDIEKETIIWKSSAIIQGRWFDILFSNPNTNWKIVLKRIFTNYEAFQVKHGLSLLGHQIIIPLLDFINDSNEPLEEEFHYEIEQYLEIVLRWLSEQKKISPAIMQILTDLFSLTSQTLAELSYENWLLIVQSAMKFEDKMSQTGAQIFVIAPMFLGRVPSVMKLLPLVFQPLHDNLENKIETGEIWKEFLFLMGSELYYFAETNRFTWKKNRYDIVPEWDRCEFLRRSLVCAFVRNKWNPLFLIDTVRNLKTFNDIIEFCVSSKAGEKFAKRLFELLEQNRNNKFIDYYSILYNHLK